MRPVIAWPVALLLSSLAVTAFINGDAVNEWVQENSISIATDEDPIMIGIQDKENWLVVLIDFPDQDETENCDQERASNFVGDSIDQHLDQTAGRDIEFEITFHDKIVTTNFAMSTYGADSGSVRDKGIDGQSPHTLAEQVVKSVKNDVDWEKFDLNDDGWVDRFLLLHCASPQEDGGGAAERIWSHFSSIENNVDLGDGLQIGHYSIASQRTSTNLGTMIHEMYHQLGAVDLYPVHDETVLQSWKGIGKWDIMASGNWNSNGVKPALPTTPVIEIMGVDRFNNVELSWPVQNEYCSGAEVIVGPHSNNSNSLKINIGDGEYVWVENRNKSGFDTHLPGDGLLVLQQDLLSGDLEDNLVNSHPERPWLFVIEADGRQDMVHNNSEGEYSDLFQDGERFGAEGIKIRNRDGVLVDWTANVSKDNENFIVKFESQNCGHSSNIDLPDYGSVLTPSDNIPLTLQCEEIILNLISTDGRDLIFENGFLKFSDEGIVGVLGHISGQIECDSGTPFDIKHDFEIFGNIPLETTHKVSIPYDEVSEFSIPIQMTGDEKQTWLIGIDGPLERVATTSTTQQLKDGSVIVIEVDPDGLLSPGMLARGELVIASDSGHKWIIEIEATAEDENISELNEWRKPGVLIPIALGLASLWVLMGINSSSREVASEHEETPATSIQSDQPAFVDPFSESY